MDPAGVALGAIAIVLAFKGAIDTVLLIEAFIDSSESDSRHWALRYHIQKTRLEVWGDEWRVDDQELCTLASKTDRVKIIIERILDEISALNRRIDGLVNKHNIERKAGGSIRYRFRWTIRAKDEFKDNVNKFKELVDDLYGFTSHPERTRLMTTGFLPQILAAVESSRMLQSLSEQPPEDDHVLSLSAKVKMIQDQISHDEYSTRLTHLGPPRPDFRLLENSQSMGMVTTPDGRVFPAWVEWKSFSPGPQAKQYLQRIEALGYLLDKVSEPGLRLPPFYGIYDDLAYELDSGLRRIGYIFGAPDHLVDVYGNRHELNRNVIECPPRSLSSLMRDHKATPPLLDDRFRLAHALASAFGLFHAAGWLHKGLHSGSILFLQESNGATAFSEPFITGFQYSRPQQQASLSQGPLEDDKLQHYYHPATDKGFSKRLDLYSLGVVLCEIGRWGLIADSTFKERRKALADRTAWRNYIMRTWLADLGWRMGKKYQDAVGVLLECQLPSDELGDGFFAQEFYRKVIQPLSACYV
ncbi:hypothetical protein ACHAPT_002181 [Fusarium lateritium]